jgi:hypothetical protein
MWRVSNWNRPTNPTLEPTAASSSVCGRRGKLAGQYREEPSIRRGADLPQDWSQCRHALSLKVPVPPAPPPPGLYPQALATLNDPQVYRAGSFTVNETSRVGKAILVLQARDIPVTVLDINTSGTEAAQHAGSCLCAVLMRRKSEASLLLPMLWVSNYRP